MMLGLLVSALVRKEEVDDAVARSPRHRPGGVLRCAAQAERCPRVEQLSWLVPSRWALGAMAGTVDLARIVPGELTSDPLFGHAAGVWLLNMGMMVVLGRLR
ncbi:hypothetical protein SANTM175S_08826 [Streptomyces antimycoticus]